MIVRVAATRACSRSSQSRSVRGSSARTRAAPSSEVARPATSSRTRGYSRTRSACAFTTPSQCLAQLPFRDGADGASFGSPLELGHHLAHHGADISGSCRDRGADGGAQLVLARLRRKIVLQQSDLYTFLFGEVVPIALLVHVDGFAALLDPAADDVDHVVVGEIALQLDLSILRFRECSAKEEGACLVRRFSCCGEIALQAREERGHQPWRLRRFLRTAAFIFRFRRSLGFS